MSNGLDETAAFEAPAGGYPPKGIDFVRDASFSNSLVAVHQERPSKAGPGNLGGHPRCHSPRGEDAVAEKRQQSVRANEPALLM